MASATMRFDERGSENQLSQRSARRWGLPPGACSRGERERRGTERACSRLAVSPDAVGTGSCFSSLKTGSISRFNLIEGGEG
jgi:hypothetical protein